MYGIDLGTTNSVISIIESNGEPRVIENKNGNRITPSAVFFVKDSADIIVGENAKKQYSMDPSHTILSIKRLMGTSQKIEIDGVEYAPEVISSKIIRKLVDDANERLGLNINQVVITVPAYFDDRQRNATKQAGEIAGLEVIRIINEPTAAALAYGLDQREPRTICVYDFGGGTFDVSILTIGENICEVNSTSGNTQLGGDDLDKCIQDWVIDLFQRDHSIDLRQQPLAMSRLREESEIAKRMLSESSSANILIPFITMGSDGNPINLQYTITQKDFAEMSNDLIVQTIDCVKAALEDAEMTKDDISEILLVGGSTRIPMVQDAITTFFGKTPNRNINPDEVVSIGAAVNAGIIGGIIKNIILADVTPLTLAVEVEGGLSEPMIKRNTTIPTTHTQSFTTSEDGQTSVTVHITQGERAEADKNRSLGKFTLDGIIPSPSGTPDIKVKFDIDVNGILSVSAKDIATGKEAFITISEGDNLTHEDLRKMIEDGKKFADEDRNKRQIIELSNLAERLIYQSEKTLDEYKEQLPEDVVEQIQGSIDSTKSNLDVKNPEVIKTSINQLKEDILQVGKYIYKK